MSVVVTQADVMAGADADDGAIATARALADRDCGASQSDMRKARKEYLAQAFAAHREAHTAGLVLDLSGNDLGRLFAMFSKAADFTQFRDQRIHDVLRAALKTTKP